jgi:hypothetical protein
MSSFSRSNDGTTTPAGVIPAQPDTCPTYAWCKRTGDHLGMGHGGDETAAYTADGDHPYLAGLIVAQDDKPVVAVYLDTWHDLTPQQLRVETGRIRAQCDRLDGLAGLLDGGAETPDTVACPVHPDWCAQRGDHHDHVSNPIGIPSAKPDEPDYVDAVLVHLSGSKPCLGLGGADLTADQAHQEADKLRAFAARVDAMASLLADTEAAR